MVRSRQPTALPQAAKPVGQLTLPPVVAFRGGTGAAGDGEVNLRANPVQVDLAVPGEGGADGGHGAVQSLAQFGGTTARL